MPKFDAPGFATSTASGAATGSAFGPIGTGVGAVAGGLLHIFGRGKKKSRRPKKISTLDKTQEDLYKENARGVNGQGGRFQDLYNFDSKAATENWKKNFADPAYQQFQEEVVPKITGAFRGGNLQNSSYLGGALAKQGGDIQKNLNAHLSNMLYNGQQQSVQNRIKGINDIMNTKTFDWQQPQVGAGDQAIQALHETGGKALGSYVSNMFNNKSEKQAPQTKIGQLASQNAYQAGNFSMKPNGSNISTNGGG